MGYKNNGESDGCQPKNRGKNFPQKWMVKIMVQNPMNKWDDLGVKNLIFGSTPISHLRHLPRSGGFPIIFGSTPRFREKVDVCDDV